MYLVLQAAVLALRVLPDDRDVDVFVAGPHSRERLAVHHIGIKIQSCAAVRQGTDRKSQPSSDSSKSVVLCTT